MIIHASNGIFHLLKTLFHYVDDITEILLNVALNTITITHPLGYFHPLGYVLWYVLS